MASKGVMGGTSGRCFRSGSRLAFVSVNAPWQVVACRFSVNKWLFFKENGYFCREIKEAKHESENLLYGHSGLLVRCPCVFASSLGHPSPVASKGIVGRTRLCGCLRAVAGGCGGAHGSASCFGDDERPRCSEWRQTRLSESGPLFLARFNEARRPALCEPGWRIES